MNANGTTRTIAIAALILSLAALIRPLPRPAEARAPDSWQAERQYPPLVFHSKAWLDCSISSTRNGLQAMNTVEGQGFTFRTAMLPIKNGVVKVKQPGMMYKFDGFPAHPIPARFTGLGEGTITSFKAEVEVSVRRFAQPAGRGTEISFTAQDVSQDSAYVEFTGLFVRARDHKRFPFRVLFGNMPSGGGKVIPKDS